MTRTINNRLQAADNKKRETTKVSEKTKDGQQTSTREAKKNGKL